MIKLTECDGNLALNVCERAIDQLLDAYYADTKKGTISVLVSALPLCYAGGIPKRIEALCAEHWTVTHGGGAVTFTPKP